MTTKELHVLEGIAKHGPCTLDEITSAGEFTRSSVYRSLTKLESCGWVRRSLDGRRYLLSNKIEKVVDRAAVPSLHAELILDAIKSSLAASRISVTLLQHVKGETFEIVDTNGGQSEALRMMFEMQEAIAAMAKVSLLMARGGGVEGQSSVNLVRLQPTASEAAGSEWYVIDDYSQLSGIPLYSSSEGLFVILCGIRNSIRYNRAELEIFSEQLCSSLGKLSESALTDRDPLNGDHRRRRSIVRFVAQ